MEILQLFKHCNHESIGIVEVYRILSFLLLVSLVSSLCLYTTDPICNDMFQIMSSKNTPMKPISNEEDAPTMSGPRQSHPDQVLKMS